MKRTALTLLLLFAFSTIFAGVNCIAVGKAEVVGAETTQSTSILVSHFDVDIVYAYATGGYYAAMAIVNFTRIPNQTIPADGVSDVYTLELYSHGQMIGSHVIGCTIGAGPSMDYMMGVSMSVGHFGLTSVERSRLTTWDIPYDPSDPSFVEPLTVKLIKTGWIVVEGNYTWSSLNHYEVVEEVYLVQYQDGYLYNNLVPQQQLNDPKHPPLPTSQTSPTPSSMTTSNSSPTPKPVSLLALTPVLKTAIVVISIVLVAFMGVGLLGYFKKRKLRLDESVKKP